MMVVQSGADGGVLPGLPGLSGEERLMVSSAQSGDEAIFRLKI